MSEPNEFEAASCTGKVRFASYADATRIQKRRSIHRDHGKRGQEAYRCKVCCGWHIGRRAQHERPKHEWQRWKRRYEARVDAE